MRSEILYTDLEIRWCFKPWVWIRSLKRIGLVRKEWDHKWNHEEQRYLFKGQNMEEQPTGKTKLQQTEAEKCGAIKVQGREGFNFQKSSTKFGNQKNEKQ